MSSLMAISRVRIGDSVLKAMHDPGRARDFAECADMGQSGRAVARFQHDFRDLFTLRQFLLDPGKDLPRLLERPGARGETEVGT